MTHNYLITGATGMLGRDIQHALAGKPVTALGRADLDVTDTDAVERAVAGHDVVINCAAYTKVDDAETDEDAAFAVNATGPANLARAAATHGARLVQVSTDYVFDGAATEPYAENAPRHPISAYGRTKAQGEVLALTLNPGATYVVRTAWTYGEHGPNFAKTMLKLATTHDTVSVVNDQHGQPTWTMDVAQQIVHMLEKGLTPGIYHATSSGQTTWFEFTKEIFRAVGLDPERVTPTTSAAFVRPAPRPASSVLGHDSWQRGGMEPLRDWREALAAAAASGVLQSS
ncbi:MAG: dTDP-4-dehydrorhamnose reductase [Terrimesophilobacter sp.]